MNFEDSTMTQTTSISRRVFNTAAAAVLAGVGLAASAQQAVTLLNVSYDPTRELYVEFNAAFAKHWKAKTGQNVTIKQSDGGFGEKRRRPPQTRRRAASRPPALGR